MFYCIMAGGRIGTPATPTTELPVTIYNCFLSINIITKSSITNAAETLYSPLLIAMQSSPNYYTVGLRWTSGKFFSRSLVCIIDKGCVLSRILMIYSSTIILCSKGIDSKLTYSLAWPVRCMSSINNFV